MNDCMFTQKPTCDARTPFPVVVADLAGMVWSHSNPAELYRWISRRNDLLETIAVACPHGPTRLHGRLKSGSIH